KNLATLISGGVPGHFEGRIEPSFYPRSPGVPHRWIDDEPKRQEARREFQPAALAGCNNTNTSRSSGRHRNVDPEARNVPLPRMDGNSSAVALYDARADSKPGDDPEMM